MYYTTKNTFVTTVTTNLLEGFYCEANADNMKVRVKAYGGLGKTKGSEGELKLVR